MKKILLAVALAGQALIAAAANPQVELNTSAGTIVLELYPEKAPKTVANFLEYVKSGFYDGLVFHRVIDGFMIQGGGFTADMDQKPVKAPIENEAKNAAHSPKTSPKKNSRSTTSSRVRPPNSRTPKPSS